MWPYGRVRASMGNELWRGRLGLIEEQNNIDIWIHAASVGEAKVAGYLIDYVVKKEPQTRIYLTTMTVAGHEIAKSIKSKSVLTGYFPIDQMAAISRTFKQIKPRIVVIAETEIWPNLITTAHSQNVPMVLVNGRMSNKAFKKYKLFPRTMSRLLSCYEKFLVKTNSDKQKFSFFGVSEKKLAVIGDMKFDAPLLPRSAGRIQEIRGRLGAAASDFVFVAGSTRPGEEALLIQMYQKLKIQSKQVHLVIAPRHLNRLDEIKSELSKQAIAYAIYGSDSIKNNVTLVEEMGVLEDLYLAADLAFVGGTLVDIGGHNILEPVWAGTPVVFGPYTTNVKEAEEYILKNNYGAVVSGVELLTDITVKLMQLETRFNVKDETETLHSPTAIAGKYILELLTNA